jgi:cell division protein FtsI/penicillin-binding protein 2
MKFEKRTPQLRLKLEGWRSRFVLVVVIGGFAVLAARAFYLQGMQTTFLQAKGEQRYGRVLEMPASRGPVKDRNGQPLAISTPVESIWTSPEDVDIEEAQVRALAKALAIAPEEIRQKIARKDRQFVYLKRQISPDQAAKVMALRIPGVFQQREYRRYYPAGEVMAHVVGFTGMEESGQEGIELAAQERLAGVPGSRKVIKDRKGRIVEDVEAMRAPRDGQEVDLAIDQRLQFLAHRELKAAVEANKAKGGSMVILDARTGFPGEAKGLLRPWDKWRPIEQATMSYGMGISVSLLQVARAYTIFTNEGQLLPLSLLKTDAQPIGKQLITRATALEVTRMMEMAASPGGTAPQAQVPGYRVAGKTGTAHKAEAGGYAAHKYVSSFVGFGPVSNPRFIVAVMLDEPAGAKYYGGDVGAPVFSSVMGSALRMMSVAPDAPQTLNVKAPGHGEIEARAAPKAGGQG